MKEFLLVFRRDASVNEPPMSPEQIQTMMKPWQDWIGSIAAQNKLVTAGNRETMEEAVELSKNCPILFNGGSVEVRTIVPMD